MYVPGFCMTSGLLCVVSPLYVGLFTHQLKWMPFNEWLSSVLLGIPLGLMASGVMTVSEWWRRTDAPIMKKIVVSAVVTAILMGTMYQMVLGINILLPH
jgi:hypothetical protein